MPSFPTPTGKTETNARNTCIRSVGNSVAGKACSKIIKNFDMKTFIDQCVTDVRVSMNTGNENMPKVRKKTLQTCLDVQRG